MYEEAQEIKNYELGNEKLFIDKMSHALVNSYTISASSNNHKMCQKRRQFLCLKGREEKSSEKCKQKFV